MDTYFWSTTEEKKFIFFIYKTLFSVFLYLYEYPIGFESFIQDIYFLKSDKRD